jgi:RNA polymerase sigma factor (sigma-70 family)
MRYVDLVTGAQGVDSMTLSHVGAPLRRLEQCQRFLEQFQASLVRVAIRQFHLDDEASRDLVQEVLANWLSYAHARNGDVEYTSPEHFFATLHRMLIQRFIDRRRRPASKVEALTDDVPTQSGIENLAILLQQKELIRDELSKLPERRITALRLCYVDGWTQDEVADKLSLDRRLVSEWKRKLEARLQKRAKEIGLDD